MAADFQIYQIYFDPNQRKNLDPAFIPYDNAGSTAPDEFEFHVFRKEYEKAQLPEHGHLGYVSWRFREKTNITGADFLDFCRNHPGYDVYYINPFPHEIYQGNVWDQGERAHPGLQKLADHVFAKLGYDIETARVPRSLRLSAFCNYWVGNRKFWDEFMAFCLPVADLLLTGLPKDLQRQLRRQAGPERKASYFTFILERLFTTFLASRPDIRALGYSYAETQLRKKYPPELATLLNEVQKLEAQFESDPAPLERSPALVAGLNLYRQSIEHQPNPWTQLGQKILRLNPFHEKIQRHPLYRQLWRQIFGAQRSVVMNQIKEVLCWNRRYLLLNLVARNIKLRYRNSWFGALWTVLLPAGSALIYFFVFNFVLKVQTPNFLSFVVLGTLIWTFVASSVNSGMDALMSNRNLLNKVALPPQALVYAEIVACLLNLIFAIPVIALVFLYQGVALDWQVSLVPLFIVCLFAQMIGLSLITSIIYVFFRDVKHLIVIVLQAWFYVTPVLYNLERWPDRFRWLIYFNPLAFIFDETQKSLLGLGLPNWQHIGVSAVWSFGLLALGFYTLITYRHKAIELL